VCLECKLFQEIFYSENSSKVVQIHLCQFDVQRIHQCQVDFLKVRQTYRQHILYRTLKFYRYQTTVVVL